MALNRRTTRMGTLAMVSLLLLGALGARLWFLQGTQAEEYQAQLAAEKTRSVLVSPERGRIIDAKGRVVAGNRRSLIVAIDRAYLLDKQVRLNLLTALSGPLNTPVLELQRRYNPCFPDKTINSCDKGITYDNLLPVPIKEDVDEATAAYILERSELYRGVSIVEGWERVYPYGSLAAHVVGYMGAITAETKDFYLDQGYKLSQRVGQAGIELSMEPFLRGSWGVRVFRIDAAGSIVEELKDASVEPVAGYDIQLSIDLDVQLYAEQVLETQLKLRRQVPADAPLGVEKQQRNIMITDPFTLEERLLEPSLPEGPVPYKAPAGSVVVMNQETGAIIAMASYPTFDPRWIGSGISRDKYNQLFPDVKLPNDPEKSDPDFSLFVNRAIQGNYNLGSTIKPFVAWSALHSGITTPYEPWDDFEGTYKLTTIEPDRCKEVKCVFKNAVDNQGIPSRYGTIVLQDALAVSSDTYFYRLADRFYADETRTGELQRDLTQWGFGSESGIMLPYEWGGRVPTDEIKADLLEREILSPGEVPYMTPGDLVQVAIGQGLMAATPLQITNAYATLGNGGKLLRPQILTAILEPGTPEDPAKAGWLDLTRATVFQSFTEPEVRLQLDMPPTDYAEIVTGLTRVVKGPVFAGGVRYPGNRYRSPTGEKLFSTYPYSKLPIAGKTGTAQGFKSLPWNDSSAFAGFSLDPAQPYTVGAYLEKSGYGSRGAGPVVKCIYTMLAGDITPDPVLVADPLDFNSTVNAPARQLSDPSCLGGADVTTRD